MYYNQGKCLILTAKKYWLNCIYDGLHLRIKRCCQIIPKLNIKVVEFGHEFFWVTFQECDKKLCLVKK